MTQRVLIDTGPLVAIFSRRDAHHEACVEQLRELAPPLWTCWPVLTEAAWLLRRYPGAIQRLLANFEAGLFRVLVLEQKAVPWIARFLQRYRELGGQLADAAIMYLVEHEGIETVFTLDRRDFSVYQVAGRTVRLLP